MVLSGGGRLAYEREKVGPIQVRTGCELAGDFDAVLGLHLAVSQAGDVHPLRVEREEALDAIGRGAGATLSFERDGLWAPGSDALSGFDRRRETDGAHGPHRGVVESEACVTAKNLHVDDVSVFRDQGGE